jgi:2',3'-cyclic-nucleotide 2'-phosphodiesterase (5'-nucleotidase family)
MNLTRIASIFSLVLAAGFVQAADNPEVGGNGPSQAAADALRVYANTDGAFLAAGLVKSNAPKDRLEAILEYPTDELVVLNLTGTQLKQAFERSLSLFPQANTSFLQISGFEVTFNKAGAPNNRVVSVAAGGSKIQDGKTYSVAMPSSLGRGGLGYFKIWDKSNIVKTYAGVTVESILSGKSSSDSPSRWISQ